MREIIFRGKRLCDGCFVEGWLVPFSNAFYIGKDNRMCIENGPYSLQQSNIHVIEPETIGQYTGLTDKNETKIFEGDICQFTVFNWDGGDTQYKGVVVYDGSRFMLWKSPESEYYGDNGGFDLDWVRIQDDEFKVIGNIYENPELINAPEV